MSDRFAPTQLRRAVADKITTDARGCWLWTGRIMPDGYGTFGRRLAHRVVFETFAGSIPDDLELDHLCRVLSCVNPAHLEPVTHDENIRRRYELVTHCVSGHEFTPENTYIRKVGNRRRQCRQCNRDAVRRYRLRRIGRAA